MSSTSDKIMMLALKRGNLDTTDGGPVRLTAKGFAAANVITARVMLEENDLLTREDMDEMIRYLKDAESTIAMLSDAEEL